MKCRRKGFLRLERVSTLVVRDFMGTSETKQSLYLMGLFVVVDLATLALGFVPAWLLG
jgi:hypothetical protein